MKIIYSWRNLVMRKIYVIDTNILIHAPEAILNFEDNEVVLPMVVLEELDGLKNSEKEKGRNAREAIRHLENLRVRGNLVEGVETEQRGIIRVEKNYVDIELPPDMPEDKMDNRILKVCLGLQKDHLEGQIILVTKDMLLRIKAQMLSIMAQDYTTDRILKEEEQYSGRLEVYVEEDHFKELKKKGIKPEYIYQMGEDGIRHQVVPEMNQFLILRADQSMKKTQLGRFDGTKIVPLQYKKSKPYGVSPRNVGQYFLQEALMKSAEDAPLVIVKGMAGTAKTFYAVAVGLEKVFNAEKKEYRKFLISRPNAQFDDDIGYLPGTEQEKISPLMRPIIDNLEQLIDSD